MERINEAAMPTIFPAVSQKLPRARYSASVWNVRESALKICFIIVEEETQFQIIGLAVGSRRPKAK